MKINYLQRGKTSSTVFIRITDKRFNCFLKTKFSVPLTEWDNKLQCSRNDNDLNIKLLKLRSSLQEKIIKQLNSGKELNLELAKGIYNGIVNPIVATNYSLLEYIDVFCNSCNSINVKKKILTMRSQISKLPPVAVVDIDFKWMNSFQKHLLKQDFAHSYINKLVSLVTQVLRYAATNDITIKPSALAIKNLKEHTASHYLNNEELNKLFNLTDLAPRLENTKKLFLIGCFTGLRVSDLMRINEFKIEDGFIHLQTKKTKSNVVIPISPRIESYLGNIKPISPNVFNRYIKELCRIAGLDEVVEGYIEGKNDRRVFGKYPKWQCISSHTMRRSFCTNLYGKLPTLVIMGITTHTTESSFLKYIKRPQISSALEMQAYFQKDTTF